MNSETGVCLGLCSGTGGGAARPPAPMDSGGPRIARWNLTRWTALAGSKGGRCVGALMSSGSAKEFEEFARDCVRLAEQADTPELGRNCSTWRGNGCGR